MQLIYDPDEAPSVLNDIYYNSRMRPLLIGIAIVLAAGVVLLVWRRRYRARQREELAHTHPRI